MLRLASSCLSLCLLAACGGPTTTADAGVPPGDGGPFWDFTAPTGSTPNSFLITVTGEGAATGGTPFPPVAADGTPYFLDGWELHYSRVLVTVGAVELSDNPDLNPNDQAQTGALVAKVAGPWAVDLSKGGPLSAKEGNGQALALTRVANQNQKAGTPAFDPVSKYALGFSLVTAQQGVWNVNLDADAQAAYLDMVARGEAVRLEGTATWRGDQGAPACRSTSPTYDFGRYPKTVAFSLGFKTPVNFKNCINPELSPADSRGVQTSTNAQTLAQLTFHLDHPFWEALVEDAPLRWDVIAARQSVASGAGPANVRVTLDDLTAVDFQGPKDAQGNAIPWRTCGPVQGVERTSGFVSYDPANVPVSAAGGATGLANLAEYMAYNLSTFGHLNNDGLCFPQRQYPAPP